MATTKSYVSILIVLLVVATGSFYAGRMTAPKETLERITFILDWSMTGNHAGYVAAVDKGFYAEEGLAVTILRGYGSTDTARRIFAGEGQFGNIANSVLIKARAEGIPLKQVHMYHAHLPTGVFGLPGTGPTTPDEMRGKRIATTTGSDGLEFEIICGLNGVDVETEVDRVFVATAAKTPAVLTGDADACTGYVLNEAVAIAHGAEIPFEDVKKIMFYDWGLDIYANGIAALDDYIEEHPDIVARFVRGSVKGLAWAMQNPEETGEILASWLPEIPEEVLLEEWLLTIDLIWSKEVPEVGLGYMLENKIQLGIDITVQIYGIEPPSLEEVYTNEFVEDLPDEIKFPLA